MDIEAGKSSFIAFLPISLITQKGPMKIGHSYPDLSFSCRCFVEKRTQSRCGYLKIFAHGLCVLFSSPPRLASSVIVITTLIIAFAHSLQFLEYVYFIAATMSYLL